MKHKVAVVMGGFSSEYDVSIASGNLVYESLSRDLFECYRVVISRKSWYVHLDNDEKIAVNRGDFSFELNGQSVQFDTIFNAIHGNPGEDGPLAGYLQLLEIPQTSSDHFSSALCFSKIESSLLVQQYGITIPAAKYIYQKDTYHEADILNAIGLPCFVKPCRSGSSIGVSKVNTAADFKPAVEMAFEIDNQVVVERMISGTEVACGVSNHTGKVMAFACTDVVPKNEFFDYESKYNGESEEVTPARIDSDVYESIMRNTEYIYEKLHLNGLARVDYIVDENNDAYFIEVNTVPGLSPESILPRQIAYCNLTLGEVFDHCVLSSLNQKT